MRNIRYSIGERLKDIRTYYGYTQKQIAHILNISRSLYTHFELNVKMITLQHLVTLTNFYQVSVDSLLALTEDYDKASEKITLNANIISSNIKTIRKELKLFTKDLAYKLNYGITTINDYENKRYMVSTSYLYDLARYSSISIDWMLGRNVKKLHQFR